MRATANNNRQANNGHFLNIEKHFRFILHCTGTAHIKISTQFPDSGRGVIQRRCQWRCHLPPALTGESTMGDFVPPQILLGKSIIKDIDIKPDPIN